MFIWAAVYLIKLADSINGRLFIKGFLGQAWWLTSLMSATREAEVEMLQFETSLGKKVSKTLSQRTR
jgi:hypothetical protein